MACRLRPDGTWEFDTLREAVEFERLRKGTSSDAPFAAPKKQAPASPTRSHHASEDDERGERALRLLASAGKKGIPSLELAPQLGLAHAKGISSVAQQARRKIEAVANGTPVEKIFWAEGKAGNRRWHVDAAKLKELGLV